MRPLHGLFSSGFHCRSRRTSFTAVFPAPDRATLRYRPGFRSRQVLVSVPSSGAGIISDLRVKGYSMRHTLSSPQCAGVSSFRLITSCPIHLLLIHSHPCPPSFLDTTSPSSANGRQQRTPWRCSSAQQKARNAALLCLIRCLLSTNMAAIGLLCYHRKFISDSPLRTSHPAPRSCTRHAVFLSTSAQFTAALQV